uniref:Glycosyltransferase family 92 protein n=1 Tax=Plectus sambesii TaxID=2011161 RepID=A0A914WC48_9BILA
MPIRRRLGYLPALVLIFFLCVLLYAFQLHSLISTSRSIDGIEQTADQLDNYKDEPPNKAQLKLQNSPLENEADTADKALLESPVQDWVKFVRLSDDIFLYSVILDLRDGNMDYPCVRIVAIVRRRQSITCNFAGNSSVAASFYELSENHGLSYGAFVLSCKIPQQIKPETVTSFIVQQDETKTYVNVQYTVTEKVPPSMPLTYGICIPVLYGSRYGAANLVEFMELNRIIGAGHVFIYLQHDRLSAEMIKVVNYYKAKRMLTTLEFKLPVSEQIIWYYGQLLAIQDCLYRNMGFAKYLAFQDLDELFVPYSSENIVSMLNPLFSANSSLASLRIPTRYIKASEEELAHPPLAMKLTMAAEAEDVLFTKCVVRPEMVFEQGIHHTSRVIQHHYQTVALPSSFGQLHHYKNYPSSVSNERVPKTYGKKFLARYEQVISELQVKS